MMQTVKLYLTNLKFDAEESKFSVKIRYLLNFALSGIQVIDIGNEFNFKFWDFALDITLNAIGKS